MGQRLACDGFLNVARGEIGVAAVPGERDSARIQEYRSARTRPPSWWIKDEVPWCSDFANWVTREAGILGTGSASARSWLKWGETIAEPIPGCVVVFPRPPLPGSGHVAFYDPAGEVARKPGQLIVLGGNQGNRVSWQARPLKGLRGVLGYRVPRVDQLPEELRAA